MILSTFAALPPTILFPALLGGLTVFETGGGATGTVASYDEVTGAPLGGPPALAGIRLLGIDFNERSPLREFEDGRPRLRTDVPGAARVVLPNRRGSLYRYARSVGSAGDVFGFFRVAPDGTAQSLIELAGTGPAGLGDPFVHRIAVPPDGDAFLCATTVAAGGNLLEVAVVSGPSVIDRTSSLPPLRFAGSGLALTSSFGIGASTRALLRFDRGGNGAASIVSFAPDPYPAIYTSQVVTSRNGQWAATTAGISGAQLHVYAFGATGPARRATPVPGPVSGSGTLAGEPTGPFLAISDDGSMCAWRTEGPTRECFLGRAPMQAGQPPQQVSSDQNFTNTLDEVGLFHFRPDGGMVFAIGEVTTPPGAGIEKVDFFLATLPAGGGPPNLVNLSQTSSDLTVPFLSPGAIAPLGTTILPGGTSLLYFDDSGNQGSVYGLRTNVPGQIQLLANVKSLDLVEIVGRRMLLGVRSAVGSEPEDLYRARTSLSEAPSFVLSSAPGTLYVRPAARRDGWVSFVVQQVGAESLDRVDLVSGALEVFPGSPATFGPTLGHSGFGSVALSTGAPPSVATYLTWPFGGPPPVTMQSSGTPGFVLPGL